MATKSECFKCYRQRQRAADEPVDRHSPGIRREQREQLKAYSKLMIALSELGVSRKRVLQVRDIVAPYIAPVAEFLRAGERERSCVHVHDDVDGPRKPLPSMRDEDDQLAG